MPKKPTLEQRMAWHIEHQQHCSCRGIPLKLLEKIKKFNIGFCLIFGLMLFVFSCKRDVETPVEMGYDYFPVKKGHWVIYDVDSTYYDNFNNTVTNHRFQLKEIIESQFIDNSGKLTQRIERYKRKNDSLAWTISDVWTSNLSTTTAERVEENERFVKLIFPVKQDKKWNGNSYNTQNEWEYQYVSVHQPAKVTFSFDSTVTVTQTGLNDPIINTQRAKEIYAKHVGLIYKEYTKLASQMDTSGIKRDTIGMEYKMTLIDYAK